MAGARLVQVYLVFASLCFSGATARLRAREVAGSRVIQSVTFRQLRNDGAELEGFVQSRQADKNNAGKNNDKGRRTASPTPAPTSAPTKDKRANNKNKTTTPTEFPTSSPSVAPSLSPTGAPSPSPTASPTLSPSHWPTPWTTAYPTIAPTGEPSDFPTPEPTGGPSVAPTPDPFKDQSRVLALKTFDIGLSARDSLLFTDELAVRRSLSEYLAAGISLGESIKFVGLDLITSVFHDNRTEVWYRYEGMVVFDKTVSEDDQAEVWSQQKELLSDFEKLQQAVENSQQLAKNELLVLDLVFDADPETSSPIIIPVFTSLRAFDIQVSSSNGVAIEEKNLRTSLQDYIMNNLVLVAPARNVTLQLLASELDDSSGETWHRYAGQVFLDTDQGNDNSFEVWSEQSHILMDRKALQQSMNDNLALAGQEISVLNLILTGNFVSDNDGDNDTDDEYKDDDWYAQTTNSSSDDIPTGWIILGGILVSLISIAAAGVVLYTRFWAVQQKKKYARSDIEKGTKKSRGGHPPNSGDEQQVDETSRVDDYDDNESISTLSLIGRKTSAMFLPVLSFLAQHEAEASDDDDDSENGADVSRGRAAKGSRHSNSAILQRSSRQKSNNLNNKSNNMTDREKKAQEVVNAITDKVIWSSTMAAVKANGTSIANHQYLVPKDAPPIIRQFSHDSDESSLTLASDWQMASSMLFDGDEGMTTGSQAADDEMSDIVVYNNGEETAVKILQTVMADTFANSHELLADDSASGKGQAAASTSMDGDCKSDDDSNVVTTEENVVGNKDETVIALESCGDEKGNDTVENGTATGVNEDAGNKVEIAVALDSDEKDDVQDNGDDAVVENGNAKTNDDNDDDDVDEADALKLLQSIASTEEPDLGSEEEEI